MTNSRTVDANAIFECNGMRVARLFTFLIVLSACPAGLAQVAPYDTIVRHSPTEVRGGPSSVFPVTALLRQGQTVRVLKEERGWLGIVPPEGSTSWVQERFLDKAPLLNQRLFCSIMADNAPVMLGSAELAEPHAQQVGTLKQGAMVEVLGQKAMSEVMGDKTTWWRIRATPAEVRWISKDGSSSNTAYSTTRPQNFVPVNESLRAQAERAERAGQFQQAIALYRQLSTEQSRPGGDANLAMWAYQRANELSRTPTTTVQQQPATPPSSPIPTSGQWASGQLMTSGPGVLRRAAFQIDNQTTYVLEDFRGYPRVYVTPQSGLNLEPFINRQVEVFGYMVNKPELNLRGYLSANKLHLLR